MGAEEEENEVEEKIETLNLNGTEEGDDNEEEEEEGVVGESSDAAASE